ncbi:hypothetical protein Pogu_1098 [Pyrobaculum oguniense TE7]|uniref:Uncharacterized protein n=1 Tax=Pyrobaculum oguniense (strain DSM 13380 / JCM 10595 / TE7) TaxID=698757 RepID=H6Q8P3_PYROT|nr:hypothetical protein Pogu_1098 [Pyrobaculum oguniense TE7]
MSPDGEYRDAHRPQPDVSATGRAHGYRRPLAGCAWAGAVLGYALRRAFSHSEYFTKAEPEHIKGYSAGTPMKEAALNA